MFLNARHEHCLKGGGGSKQAESALSILSLTGSRNSVCKGVVFLLEVNLEDIPANVLIFLINPL